MNAIDRAILSLLTWAERRVLASFCPTPASECLEIELEPLRVLPRHRSLGCLGLLRLGAPLAMRGADGRGVVTRRVRLAPAGVPLARAAAEALATLSGAR